MPDTVADVIHGRAERSPAELRRSTVVDNSAAANSAKPNSTKKVLAEAQRVNIIGPLRTALLKPDVPPRSRSTYAMPARHTKRSPGRGETPVQKSKRTSPLQGSCIRSTGNRLGTSAMGRRSGKGPCVMDASFIVNGFAELTHYAGFDWAMDKHDVVVVDKAGQIILRMCLENTAEGWAAL